MLIQDYLDICDPVLTFDRFMGGIELEKYLKNIPQHYTGRLRYDPVSMLKTVLFGFMAKGRMKNFRFFTRPYFLLALYHNIVLYWYHCCKEGGTADGTD